MIDTVLGFNKNKTSVRENSEVKINLFLFLLKFEDNILLPILATSNKESTNVIVVLDKFASCDIAIGHI